METLIVSTTILIVLIIASLLIKIAILLSDDVLEEGKITKLGIALIATLIILPFFLGYSAKTIIRSVIQ